jgi:hypothetical protein
MRLASSCVNDCLYDGTSTTYKTMDRRPENRRERYAHKRDGATIRESTLTRSDEGTLRLKCPMASRELSYSKLVTIAASPSPLEYALTLPPNALASITRSDFEKIPIVVTTLNLVLSVYDREHFCTRDGNLGVLEGYCCMYVCGRENFFLELSVTHQAARSELVRSGLPAIPQRKDSKERKTETAQHCTGPPVAAL